MGVRPKPHWVKAGRDQSAEAEEEFKPSPTNCIIQGVPSVLVRNVILNFFLVLLVVLKPTHLRKIRTINGYLVYLTLRDKTHSEHPELIAEDREPRVPSYRVLVCQIPRRQKQFPAGERQRSHWWTSKNEGALFRKEGERLIWNGGLSPKLKVPMGPTEEYQKRQGIKHKSEP